MFFDGIRPYSFFFNKFDRRQEEVMKVPPFIAVEIAINVNMYMIKYFFILFFLNCPYFCVARTIPAGTALIG